MMIDWLYDGARIRRAVLIALKHTQKYRAIPSCVALVAGMNERTLPVRLQEEVLAEYRVRVGARSGGSGFMDYSRKQWGMLPTEIKQRIRANSLNTFLGYVDAKRERAVKL